MAGAAADQTDFGTHALAVIDLDNFKLINDRHGHGHGHGDAVLVAFCREVVGMIRPFDLFGRIGGEEILFLMPTWHLRWDGIGSNCYSRASGKKA